MVEVLVVQIRAVVSASERQGGSAGSSCLQGASFDAFKCGRSCKRLSAWGASRWLAR